jgi:hypothetical protein
MNTIQLERSVPVRTFDAHATVGIGAERPEWLAVARLAKDFGGEIRAVQITTELLHGVPTVVGGRVIERCVSLCLLEQTDQERKAGIARLSGLGEKAVARGQVFVPEERTWRFYFAEDPLLRQPLLHLEALDDGNARDERDELRKQKQAGQRAYDDHERRPKCLLEALKSADVLSSVVESGPNFVLNDISDVGVLRDHKPLRLQLKWEAGHQPELLLTGELTSGSSRSTSKGTESERQTRSTLEVRRVLANPDELNQASHDEVWMTLASMAQETKTSLATLHTWLEKAGRLVMPVRFDKLFSGALNSFRKTLEVPAISGKSASKFNWLVGFAASELPDVELVPSSEEDAQQWAEWLLRESLYDYTTPDRLTGLADAVRKRFPFNAPLLPTPDKMLAAALGKPADAKSRFILAPHDLGLWS